MPVNGKTRLCGLIGHPVEHTMSPVLQNFLAERTGHNLIYVPFHVQEGDLEDAVRGAHALNAIGLNVTVPYKTEVCSLLEEIDPLAERIGAVNTLVRTERGFKGYNTDMPGLYRALLYDGVRIEGEHVMVLGAGGVARAVCLLLQQKGAADLVLLNRSTDKAQKIAEEVNRIAGREFAKVLPLDGYRELPEDARYLCIQATSVGMHPNTQEAVIEDPQFYRHLSAAYDLIFNPLETRFMQLAAAQGIPAFNGYRMLLFQGVIAFELWTGCRIPDDLAQETYEQMLLAMRGE
jgi:shikimate dehydrogenase